jgi:thioredoxin-related protein
MNSRSMLLAVGLVLSVSVAARAEGVGWLADVDAAWAASVDEGRPLLLFITRQRCKHCARMKSETYADRRLADDVSAHFIPLMIDARQEARLVKDLGITSFPTTLVVSPETGLLAELSGFIDPAELRQYLAESRQLHVALLDATLRDGRDRFQGGAASSRR